MGEYQLLEWEADLEAALAARSEQLWLFPPPAGAVCPSFEDWDKGPKLDWLPAIIDGMQFHERRDVPVAAVLARDLMDISPLYEQEDVHYLYGVPFRVVPNLPEGEVWIVPKIRNTEWVVIRG